MEVSSETGLEACFSRVFWAVVVAVGAYMVWSFGHERSTALGRPLAQVSVNDLVTDAGAAFFYGTVSFLLGWGALALFWNGLTKLWSKDEEKAE